MCSPVPMNMTGLFVAATLNKNNELRLDLQTMMMITKKGYHDTANTGVCKHHIYISWYYIINIIGLYQVILTH